MKLPSDTEIAGIVCGKEFGLIRATNGKIYYYGKSSALGLKSVGKTPSMKPIELIVAKSSNIVSATIGHDGMHAILINEDGSVYFAGKLKSCPIDFITTKKTVLKNVFFFKFVIL